MTYEWHDQGLCRTNPAPFAHDSGADAEAARRICLTPCPVKQQCLEWAMQIEDGDPKNGRDGIYGGLTPADRWTRDRVRVDKTRLRCGTHEAALRHKRLGEALDDKCAAAIEQHNQEQKARRAKRPKKGAR